MKLYFAARRAHEKRPRARHRHDRHGSRIARSTTEEGRSAVCLRPRGGRLFRLVESKERLDKRIKEAGGGKAIASWVLHDLRRTAATRMADLGVQPHVIEAVLNHVSGHKGGIAGIYNRAQYTAERARALGCGTTISLRSSRAAKATSLD